MADRTGQQLGNYRILRLIGKAGFADVYLGEHIYLNTPVALKILHTQLTNDDMEGFLNEARTIARLMHPHIVRVTDFGVDNETPFLVMDYAPNGTLRQRHPKGSILPVTTILPYVKQIADALQHAHDEKLIHRDIKPENMLLGRRNDVLLSDFGIALVAQSSCYQSTQDVVGTVAYMSPEQIQGKPRPASDQYSLAIVLYEWLSGTRPFHGSFTELCTQHMFATPPPLREKVPTIPRDVEQVVTTALAKDPKQRFMSVQAFANALEQAAQSEQPTYIKSQPDLEPKPASPDSTWPPTLEPLAPNPHQKPKPVPATPIRQYVPTTPVVNLSSYGSYPSRTSSNITSSSSVASASHTQKIEPWKFGKRQLIAALTGILICIILISFTLIPTSYSSYSSSYIISRYISAYVLLGAALVTPEFFGAVFGPWVGLCIGGLGSLTSYITAMNLDSLSRRGTLAPASQYIYPFSSCIYSGWLSSFCVFGPKLEYIHPSYEYWPIPLGLALVGFISGFAMFKMKASYNIGRTLGFSALGAVVGTVFAFTGIVIVPNVHYKYNFYFSYSVFILPLIIAVLSYVVLGLILLPPLLVAYHKIANRIKRP